MNKEAKEHKANSLEDATKRFLKPCQNLKIL